MRPGPVQLIAAWPGRPPRAFRAALTAAVFCLAAAGARAQGAADPSGAPAGLDACFEAEGLTAIAGCSDGIADPATGDWDRAVLLQRRAELYRRRHDFKAALADYDRALALTPGKPALLVGRGETLGEAPLGVAGPDALQRARADFTRALDIRPGDPTALASRAHARALLGDLDGAVADYQAALAAPGVAAVLARPGFMASTRENYAFALNARAWERLAAGAADAALADAEAAVATLPDEPTIADTRAHALAAAGRPAEALAAHERAVALGGAAWEARYRAALTAKGFAPAAGPAGLFAALQACVAVDCRPLADAD